MSDKCYIQFAKCVKNKKKSVNICMYAKKAVPLRTLSAHNAAHARQNTMKHIINKNKENKIKIEKTFF